MPRKETARPTPDRAARHVKGSVTSISVAPYTRDERWSTPLNRRRTDVFVVDVADRYGPARTSEDDPLLMTA